MIQLVKEYWILILALSLIVLTKWLFPRFNRHKFNQKKAKNILMKVRKFSGDNVEGRIFSYLRKIDPFVFEELLLHSFQDKGFKVIRNKRYTGDGGLDGKLIDKNNNLILVQAKRYSGHINNTHVKIFSQLVSKNKAAKGFFVHTGRTGKGVYKTIDDINNVDIISGDKLIKLIN